jgi:hypothetical protein
MTHPPSFLFLQSMCFKLRLELCRVRFRLGFWFRLCLRLQFRLRLRLWCFLRTV